MMLNFAIIIPVYNGENYIADCLNSLISQSYPNWIALCVNDGSTDQSLSLLEQFATQDSRIKVFSKDNGGVSKARNYALDKLSEFDYDWISFLDIDDVLAVNNLSNLVDVITEYPEVDYIRTHCKSYPCRENMILDSKSVQPVTCVNKMNADQYFDSGDVGGLTHSCHISRNLHDKYKYRFPEDMKIMEDQVFSIKFALRANSIVLTQCSDYMYFTPPPSTRCHRLTKNTPTPLQTW